MSGRPPRRGSFPDRGDWDDEDWGGRGGPPRPERRQAQQRPPRQDWQRGLPDDEDDRDYRPARGTRQGQRPPAGNAYHGGQRDASSRQDPRGYGRDDYARDDYGRESYPRDDRSGRAPSYPGQPRRAPGHDAYDPHDPYAAHGQAPQRDQWGRGNAPAPQGGPQDRSAGAWQRLGSGTAARVRAASVALREPKKGKRGVILGVVLVLLIVLVGGGVLLGPRLMNHFDPTLGDSQVLNDPYTPLPGPSPTPPANFTVFTSARSGYSVDYPKGWSMSSQSQTVQGQADYIDIFLQATQNPPASFTVEQAAAAARVPDDQVIASEVSGAAQSGVTLAPINGLPQTASVGGAEWQRRDYTVTASGKTAHEVILACHHASRSYVIVYLAPTSTFDSDVASFFTPTLYSFRFTI